MSSPTRTHQVSPALPADAQLAPLKTGADMLGVSVYTMRNYIARGAIHGYRLPGTKTIRVDLNEIRAAVEPIPTVAADSTGLPQAARR